MKLLINRAMVLIVMALTSLLSCKAPIGRRGEPPVVMRFEVNPGQQYLSNKDYPRYKEDEIIIFFKHPPTAARRAKIRNAMNLPAIQEEKTCNSCGGYVELWKAPKIHTTIHAEGVQAGSTSGSKGVGEDSLASYSLNYINRIPTYVTPNFRGQDSASFKPGSQQIVSGAGKDTVIIAVLDTGVDEPKFKQGDYLWENNLEKSANGVDEDNNCYKDDVRGWNFLNNTPNVYDDNPNLHGTLINQYIINEFLASAKNFVQIMNLKTHDANGNGDLFSTICAIYYAISKKAKIINASWGFYFYGDSPHPFLDKLITHELAGRGILFVTAAGNRMEAADSMAQQIYADVYHRRLTEQELRNLEIHRFYPAILSTATNNVIVATTTNGTAVSPTQGYADKFVDLGPQADQVTPDQMKFALPFPAITGFISGSSFATAITTGKIGAGVPRHKFSSNKEKIFDVLLTNIPPEVSISAPLRDHQQIRKGLISKHH